MTPFFILSIASRCFAINVGRISKRYLDNQTRNGKQLYSGENRHANFHGILRRHCDQKVLNKLQGWCVSV
jgi:hypothetical protein